MRWSSWPVFSAAPREICAALNWALFYEDGPISSIPMCSRRLHGCRFLSILAPQNAKPTAVCRCLELRDVESVCTAFFQIRDTGSRTICPVSGAFCVSCKASRRDHEMRSAVLLLSSTLCETRVREHALMAGSFLRGLLSSAKSFCTCASFSKHAPCA